MKILFITSSYPAIPGGGGGYSQLCEEVADGLYTKGYKIAVFTSRTHGMIVPRDYPVWRTFKLDPDWNSPFSAYLQFYFGRVRRENQALADLKKVIDTFAPDVVFIWHVVGISRVIFKWLESSSSLLIAYYIADYAVETHDEYYTYWMEPAEKNIKSIPKKIIAKSAIATLVKEGKPIHLKYENAICVSNFVKERLISRNILSNTTKVIHNGVDLKTFEASNREQSFDRLDCLAMGRLVPEKGIGTIIKAISLLAKSNEITRMKITILGEGPDDYVASLRKLIESSGLQNVISLKSMVNRNQIPKVLSEHNILIFASEWDEPMARSVQEAMAMKLLVIGTNTGGTGELLVHHKTGLVFKARDAVDLAAQLVYVLSNPNKALDLVETGCDLVRKSFSVTSTIDEIELYLSNLISKSSQQGQA